MAQSPYGTRPSDLADPVAQASAAAVAPMPIPQSQPDASAAPAQDPSGAPGTPMSGPPVGGSAVAAKPQFDPNQPFEPASGIKPAFDPNQPFTPVSGEAEGPRALDNPEAGTGAKALDLGARTLDYPGGFVRGGLANVASNLMGKGQVVTPEDLENMAKGKGPNSAEYLKRLGVNEGVSGDLPIIGHVSQRGVEGFALDVITDPITVVGKVAKMIPGVPEILSKISGAAGLGADAAAKKIGEYIYKSGFSQIDAKMVENGSKPLSEILLAEAEAPTGTTSKIAQKVTQIADTMGKMRDGLYEKATNLGVTVDLGHPLEKAESFVQGLLADKRASVRKQGEELMKYLQEDFKNAGAVDLPTLSQWKTDLYNTLPKSFFGPNGKMAPIGKQFNALLAHDFKTAIVDAGNVAEKGLGDSIEAINSKWGTLLNARKPLATQVKQAAGKAVVSPLKAVVTAHNPALGAVMEAADLAKTTAVRTNVGKALSDAGKSGAAGNFTRRAAIQSQEPETQADGE